MSVDPELAAAVAAIPPRDPSAAPPTIEESLDEFERHIAAPYIASQKERAPDESTYMVKDHSVPVEGGEITARCVVPVVDDQTATFPVLFFLHGGGFAFGDINFDDYHLRRVAVDLKISVVNVEYRLTPGHVFPTQVNDALAALKWVVQNTASLKADLSKGFILYGDSSGGNLAAALAHLARDDPFFEGRRPTGQFLREPWLAHADAYPEQLKEHFRSIEENAQYTSLPYSPTREALAGLLAIYQAPPTDPRFSPFYLSSHAGLPPAYFQAMGLDVLRDDAVVYEKVLREAGVKTKIDVYPGVPHSFHSNFPRISLAAKLWDDVHKGIEWLLRGGE